jgi:hypothetical protein
VPTLRRVISARRAALLLAVLLLAAPFAGATAPPAAAAGTLSVNVTIKGAGTVTEVTDARLMNCASPGTTPTGQVGNRCAQGGYGIGWIVELRATPAPGYTFAGWQGIADPSPVACDGADAGKFLASGTCRFQLWQDLGVEARFADATPPQTTASSAPPSPTSSRSASFGFSSDQTGSTFRCKLDGAAFGACSSGVSYSNLGDGPHTFQVAAVDPSGNQDPTPESRSWTVDATPPQTTITGGPASPTSSQSASFTFSSSEGGSTFRCKLDGGNFAACASGQTYPNMAHGQHTFQVLAADPAGNQDLSPAAWSWTVDVQGPAVAIANGPAALTTNPTAAFVVDWADAVGTECRLDGGPWSACPRSPAFTVADGAHTLGARGIDVLGNPGPASTWNWTVDTTGPGGTVAINGGKAKTGSRSVTLTLAATDPAPGSGVVQMRFRNKGTTTWSAWQPYAPTVPWKLTKGAGTKTVQVQFRDGAGNVSATAADAIRYRP